MFFTGYLSLEYMVTIPAYVTISLIVATAIQGIGKDAFVTMVKNMKTAIENIDTHYDINHGEGERTRRRERETEYRESRGEDRKTDLGRRMEVGADEGGVRGEGRKTIGERVGPG